MSYNFVRPAAAGRWAVVFAVVLAVFATFVPGASATGVGVDVAYISPEGLDGTIGVGGFLNFSTPISALQVEPYAGYWSKTEGVEGAQASLSDVTVGARGKFVIPIAAAPKIQPYVGAGAGLHFLKAGVDVSLFGETSNISVTDSKFGVDFGGGINVPITPRFSLRGEGWYSIVDTSNQVSARLGAMFSM